MWKPSPSYFVQHVDLFRRADSVNLLYKESPLNKFAELGLSGVGPAVGFSLEFRATSRWPRRFGHHHPHGSRESCRCFREGGRCCPNTLWNPFFIWLFGGAKNHAWIFAFAFSWAKHFLKWKERIIWMSDCVHHLICAVPRMPGNSAAYSFQSAWLCCSPRVLLAITCVPWHRESKVHGPHSHFLRVCSRVASSKRSTGPNFQIVLRKYSALRLTQVKPVAGALLVIEQI